MNERNLMQVLVWKNKGEIQVFSTDISNFEKVKSMVRREVDYSYDSTAAWGEVFGFYTLEEWVNEHCQDYEEFEIFEIIDVDEYDTN